MRSGKLLCSVFRVFSQEDSCSPHIIRKMNILFCHLIFVIAGLKAQASTKVQYELKGNTTCLCFTNSLKNITEIKWKVDNNLIVRDGSVTKSFIDRFQYNKVNHSLYIRNLTDTDTGIYIVTTTYKNDSEFTNSYKLIVEEAVSMPVVKITPFDFNSSAGTCNMSVNCSVGSNWAAFVCDDDSHDSRCKLSSSTTNVFINISKFNGNVECTGKNNVSIKTLLQSTNCLGGTTAPAVISHSWPDYWWFLLGGPALIAIIVVILIILKCRKSFKKSQETTRPASDKVNDSTMRGQENPSTVQEHAPVVTVGVETEADRTTSVYDIVRDQVNGPAAKEPETSIYSTIQKHGSAAVYDVARV
ncbi:uncharacterized protein si:ch1073-220m6.1 [Osmerus eperlanus]|uniref:uncharacterized protein si:ch1073-220m6.1 n=1 Tax=Osmerus eperlanus TaxID=29151 RepID=UPI002E0F43E3